MDRLLFNYINEIENIKREAVSLIESVPEDKFNVKPDSKTWSVSECLKHLINTAEMYIPSIKKVIENSLKTEGFKNKNYRHSAFMNFAIRKVEPPYKLKMKTFGSLAPAVKEYSKSEIQKEFIEAHDELLDLIKESEGIDLGKVKLKSPILPLLRMKLGEVFPFLSAHARRHLWQANKIKQSV